MHVIERILNEVVVDYNAWSANMIPVELCNTYPILKCKTGRDFSVRFALAMVKYALVKFGRESLIQDEAMEIMLVNVQTFSSMRFEGGRMVQSELNQYFADYMAFVKQNGGFLVCPKHLNDSDASSIMRLGEKIGFSLMDYLVGMILGNDYRGNSANLFRYLIGRAEGRYLVYKPLLEEYYHVLKGDSPITQSPVKPRIITCPNCGKNVSTASAKCWCCDFPVPK